MLIDENSHELLFFVLKLKEDSIGKICNVIDEKKKTNLIRVNRFGKTKK